MTQENRGVQMTEIQSKLIDMFGWFHDICESNNLTYYALGGTALGAVRHNGFIPWDDDIDVGMPRPDYEKLISLSEKINCNGKYLIEYPADKKDFVYPFIKIYDTHTTLVENKRYKPKRGLFIDVFPIDGIGNSEEESLQNFRKINKQINMLGTRVNGFRKGRKLYKNIAVFLSRLIPEYIFDTRKLISKTERMCKANLYADCRFVVNAYGAWKEKEISEKAWFEERKQCHFEGKTIYIPGEYHKYLTKMYGDYMKLPPIEKRVTHHDFIHIDLSKSYME